MNLLKGGVYKEIVVILLEKATKVKILVKALRHSLRANALREKQESISLLSCE